jgi:hypothetical protein
MRRTLPIDTLTILIPFCLHVAVACWVQTYFAWRVSDLGRNTFWKSVAVVILMVRTQRTVLAYDI